MMTGSTLILRSRLREGPGEGLSRYCNCNRPRRDRLFRQITQQTVPMRQCGGDRIDRHALVEPMGEAVARLRKQPRDAVTRHADGAEIQAVGRARAPRRYDRQTRPPPMHPLPPPPPDAGTPDPTTHLT